MLHAGGVAGSKGGSRPGRGGVSRGPGAAELTWGDESEAAGARFRETPLPEALARELEGSLRLGTSATAPEGDGVGEAGGDAAVQASTGSGAWRRRLAPRHRRAVGRYFGAAEDGR